MAETHSLHFKLSNESAKKTPQKQSTTKTNCERFVTCSRYHSSTLSLKLQVGSDNKKAARDESEAEKEAEKLRKKLEMAALLAEEEAATGGIKSKPKKIKKKDDLGALLSEGLAKAPKTKAQKEDEARKKAKEAARLKQAEEEAAAATKKPDPLAPAPLVPNQNRATFFDEEDAGSGQFEFSTSLRFTF